MFTNTDQARDFIIDNEEKARIFIEKYLARPGIAVRLAETMPYTDALRRVELAISALRDPETEALIYDTIRAIEGAVELDFLVGCAFRVRRDIIPREALPEEKLIQAYLKVFNAPF